MKPCFLQLSFGSILSTMFTLIQNYPFLGECLPGARPARYFSINYPDFSPRLTLSWRSPPTRPVLLTPSVHALLDGPHILVLLYAVAYGPFTPVPQPDTESTFARRVPRAPSIQRNVPAIYQNALPPNMTPSSSSGTLSISTLYDCWQSNNFPFFRPTNGTITCTLPL